MLQLARYDEWSAIHDPNIDAPVRIEDWGEEVTSAPISLIHVSLIQRKFEERKLKGNM